MQVRRVRPSYDENNPFSKSPANCSRTPASSDPLTQGILTPTGNAPRPKFPKTLHPNAYIPGSWTQAKELCYASKLPQLSGSFQKKPAIEEPESEHECTTDNSTRTTEISKSTNADLLEQETLHMAGPLLDNSAILDLSVLRPQRGMTSVENAVPLASFWQFDTSEDTDECSLMQILSHELESLEREDSRKSLWGMLKEMTLGPSESEYLEQHPWALYTPQNESDEESGSSRFLRLMVV